MGNQPDNSARAARARARDESEAGDRFYRQAQFHLALPHYRAAVGLWPENPDLHYMLASAAWRADELGLVEPHYLEALRLDPKHAYSSEALSHWYRSAGRMDLAERYVARALALQPHNPEFAVSRAEVLADAGDPKGAWELIEPVLDNREAADRAAIVYVKIAGKIGREEQAAQWVRQLAARPGAPPLQRPQLLFSAAALMDRMGRYDEAFEFARAAHAVFPRAYDAGGHSARVDRQIEFSAAARLRTLPHAGQGSTRPVFILGMPRSGTSLVEQILASHPRVFGAGELDALAPMAAAIESPAAPYPQCLAGLTQQDVDVMASRYLNALQPPDPASAYVTDKTPYNFLHLDLIELLFPRAHVIHCVRDPLDTCLSCYVTDFTLGNAFAWNLRSLGTYFRDYERLMRHWKRELGVAMLEVKYEDVVGDLAGQTRRMLDFLHLPWDERCVRFHENNRLVRTASREQVRRPLYASSIGRWKHYEKHLAELKEALGMLGG